MTKIEKVLVVLIGLCFGIVVLAQTYKAGENHGYAHGWSDSQCGHGNECEGGQD